jgi:hypothetical protein
MLPSLDHLSNGLVLTLDDGQTTHLHTSTQARRLGDLCRKAEVWLDEQARDRGARLDREAAVLTNEVNAELNRAWPGGTLPQVFPAPSSAVRIVACGCDYHNPCGDCGGAA